MVVPLALDLTGARVVCVGAGPVAASKALPLVDEGARVVVVAPDAVDEIRSAAVAARLVWHRRPYDSGDLRGAALVIAATARPEVDDAIASACAAVSTPCVRIDGRGTAAFMGAVRRGPLVLAVSTGGTSPALARHLRAELEGAYGPEWGELAALLGELRADEAVRAALDELPAPVRSARWRSIMDTDIVTLLREGRPQAARELALSCLCSSSG